MHVPVDACADGELGIDAGKDKAGDCGGDVGTDDVVSEGCQEDFVDVGRKGRKVEGCCEGSGETREERGARDWERVVHDGWKSGFGLSRRCYRNVMMEDGKVGGEV